MKGFGTNPGALGREDLCPADSRAGRAAGRRAPRLHPERRGLRPRQRLVRARRPPRLRPAVPRADARQQPNLCFNWYRPATRRRGQGEAPRSRRWSRHMVAGARPRPGAGLRHRPVGGRGDDLGDARHLSRTVRRRGDHRRAAVRRRRGRPRSARADARAGLAVAPRARQQDHQRRRPSRAVADAVGVARHRRQPRRPRQCRR